MSETMIKGRSQTALRIAGKALANARLRRSRALADKETRTFNLAKVLMATHPGSEHGKLLMRALRPDVINRSEAELAARWLIERGQAPTDAAVSARLEMAKLSRDARMRNMNEAARCAQTDGNAVAEFVASRIAETDQAPTWGEVYQAMQWKFGREPRNALMRSLERDGWIVCGKAPRSLRPGSRYQPVAGPRL